MTTETPDNQENELQQNDQNVENQNVEDQNAEQSQDQSQESEQQTPSGSKEVSQEEFNKLYFKLKQQERENLALQEKLNNTSNNQPKVKQEEQKTLADFDYDEEAFNSYKLEQNIQKSVESFYEKQKKEQEQDQLQQSQQETIQSFNDKAVEFAKSYPDYEKVIQDAGAIVYPEHLREAVLEIGPELDYKLLKNPQLLDSLSNMSRSKALIEVGRLMNTETPKPQGKKVSSAPDPVPSDGGVARSVSDYKYDETLSAKEYYEKYMEEKRQKLGITK